MKSYFAKMIFYQSLVLLLVVFLTGYSASPLHISNSQENLLKEEDFPDAKNIKTTELSKTLTLVHGFNDTKEIGREIASTNFTFAGGLMNKIQNFGGYQKTNVNNKIQYNFYFFLLPKDFNGTKWTVKKMNFKNKNNGK